MRRRILEEIEKERGELEKEIKELKEREEKLGGEPLPLVCALDMSSCMQISRLSRSRRFLLLQIFRHSLRRRRE
jgi:hypothetical protein